MNNIERKKFLSKIARLYYSERLTQQEIAGRLNISRTKVSRYLDEARKDKIVEIKINLPEEDYSNLEYRIEKSFKIKECIVVPTFENNEEILKMMAGPLNNLFERILAGGSYLGIGWGSSLKTIADYINVSGKSDIKVVPIIGGLGKIGTGVHTNSVAKNIADRLGSISYMIHSPAVLDSKEIREIVENDSNTREIIKLYEKIDTALVGLSDIGPDSTLIKTGSFSLEEFKYLDSLGVVGDVNLIFINENGKHVPNRIDERIVRISPDRLKKVKNVIGVAFGRRKLKVILGALRGGLINILFTDEETAENIINSG
ncbi:MAG: sugar-binding transcriptional regulator [Actinobacteria bacterium]|nr:sugar-binding transcriptional regulator [Actinomycetota bacterium]